MNSLPSWKMPTGVNASLWEYAGSQRIALDEADYFQGHPLHAVDGPLVESRFREPGAIVDLGCGIGRMSLRFARKGFDVVSVELSFAMLETLKRQADAESLKIRRVRANLCRLGCFPDRTFDYALSMFSTLGMIRGRSARSQALAEAFRILKPGGRLALHAHNLWLNLRNPQGRTWLLSQIAPRLLGRWDAGDRRMTYRGIPDMEVHLFTWGELRGELRRAGFRIEDVVCLDERTALEIPRPWLAPSIRAGGWMVFARRPH